MSASLVTFGCRLAGHLLLRAKLPVAHETSRQNVGVPDRRVDTREVSLGQPRSERGIDRKGHDGSAASKGISARARSTGRPRSDHLPPCGRAAALRGVPRTAERHHPPAGARTANSSAHACGRRCSGCTGKQATARRATFWCACSRRASPPERRPHRCRSRSCATGVAPAGSASARRTQERTPARSRCPTGRPPRPRTADG